MKTALVRMHDGKEQRGYIELKGTRVTVRRRNRDGSRDLDQSRYLSSEGAAKAAYEEALAAAFADGYAIAPTPAPAPAPVRRVRVIEKEKWPRVIRDTVLEIYDNNFGGYSDSPARDDAMSFVPYDSHGGWEGFCDELRFSFNLEDVEDDAFSHLLCGSIQEIIANLAAWWRGELVDFVDST